MMKRWVILSSLPVFAACAVTALTVRGQDHAAEPAGTQPTTRRADGPHDGRPDRMRRDDWGRYYDRKGPRRWTSRVYGPKGGGILTLFTFSDHATRRLG